MALVELPGPESQDPNNMCCGDRAAPGGGFDPILVKELPGSEQQTQEETESV